MSGILASTVAPRATGFRAALGALAPFGGDHRDLWSRGEVSVSVTRAEWETGVDFSGNVLVLATPQLVLAADATLYERAALLRSLSDAGIPIAELRTPSALIAAAYRAWGVACVDRLRGDYAFVLWDIARERLFAARDPIGSRPLFYSSGARGVQVGSSSRAVAALTGSDTDLDLATVGTQVAGFAWSVGAHSAYRGVDPLLPGHTLVRENGRTIVARFWRPPSAVDSTPSAPSQAAEELRVLLGDAVRERMSADITTVWMSGGWDSTAVFAAGQDALGESERARLRPVSISYPAGDPGCEDDLITDVAKHWGADVHWLRSVDIPLFDGIEERAACSDEPPAHLYELWNRALARGTRASGSRVAFDGGGGDQLFQVSDVILAESLRRGRVLDFMRLARSRRSRGWRHLLRAGVLPLLPPALLEAGEEFSGRRLPRHYLERSQTSWVRPDFVVRHQLRERDAAILQASRVPSLAHTESMLYLAAPVWAYGAAFMRGALLREGVEVRSPLLDLRIVEFALRRPIAERASATDTKLLLRGAMCGLLPDAFLAPRPFRTGMTTGFSRQRMSEAYPRLWSRVFASPLRLAALGIVEPRALREAVRLCLAGQCDEYTKVNLFHTLKVELWLRGRDARSERPASARTRERRNEAPAA